LARTLTVRAASGSLERQLSITVRLMVATGLRVGELCALRVQDVSPDGTSLRVHGKGSRDRIAFIADPKFRAELSRLLQGRQRADGPGGWLFLNRTGSKLKPQSIRTRLRHAAEAAGLARKVTPHMLRHTAAT